MARVSSSRSSTQTKRVSVTHPGRFALTLLPSKGEVTLDRWLLCNNQAWGRSQEKFIARLLNALRRLHNRKKLMLRDAEEIFYLLATVGEDVNVFKKASDHPGP